MSITDPGFASSQRLYAPVFVPRPEFTAAGGRIFYDQVLTRLRALPGARSAALATRLPLYAAGIETSSVSQPGSNPVDATTMIIREGFLETMEIPLVAGRDFNGADKPDGPRVAIVNQTLARRLWPNAPALG